MKKKLTIIALVLVSGFSVAAFATSTVAWFTSGTHIAFGNDPNNVNVTGGSFASYYESGSGKENDKYVISDKIHLYNLAWLQYIGYYNAYKTSFQEDAPNDIVQCYFVLKNDIDMGGLTLPPIGTEKYPFLGNFDGQGYTISNFTISNDNPVPSGSDFGVAKPSKFYGGQQSEVVGFFGVIGKLPNQSISYDSSIVSFTNTTLSNFTVKAKTSQVLIGLAGGYVNGAMSGVKINGTATLDVNGQVSTAKSSITSKLSDFGLVGYTAQTGSSGEYIQRLSEFYSNYDTSQSGQGQGDDWGGSIDMLALNQRFYRLLTTNIMQTGSTNVTTITKNRAVISNARYHRYYTNDEIGVTVYEANSGTNGNPSGWYYSKNPETTSIIYRLEGGSSTLKDKNNGNSGNTFATPNTYIPLLVDANDATLSKNTGYIAAGSNYTTTSVRTASYAISNVGLSMSPYNASSSSYDSSTLEVLSNNTVSYNSSNFRRINNGNSGNTGAVQAYEATIDPSALYGYSTAYDSMKTVLKNASFVQGLHFTGTALDKDSVITVPSAKISGTTITDYKTLCNSIDFNLSKSGSIKLFAGSYGTYGSGSSATIDCDSFFSLHAVQRNASHAITKTDEIFYIYENTNSSTKKAYPYIYYGSDNSTLIEVGYTSSNVTKGDLAFDMRWLHNAPPVLRAVYYFSIPVNSGEYALATVSNKTKGAYLMYLDIGTNGATDDKLDAHSIVYKRGGNDYPFGVDFIPTAVVGNGGESIAVSIASSERGVLTFAVSASTIAVTDTSSIAEYAYRSSKYVASNPSSSQFTVSGLTGSPPGLSEGGTRILTIGFEQVSTGNIYRILITDQLTSDAGAFTESNSTYTIEQIVNGVGQGATSTTMSAINTLIASTDKNVSVSGENSLRSLVCPAVTLERRAGSNAEFVTTYDLPTCSYEHQIVSVNIETNGASMNVTVATGYTFMIDGSTIASGSIYPVPAP